MTWGAVIVGGISATASTISANQAAGAASDAAGAQQDAANLSYADQQKLRAQQRRESLPYRESGLNALNQLNYLMGLGSSTSLAQTQDNFDPEAYRKYRIDQMTASVKSKYKNPDKQAKVIAKRTAKLDAQLADPAKAWQNYNSRLNQGLKPAGEFWKTRDGGEQQAQGEDYGFLQQRFNNDVFEKDPGYQFRMDEGNKAIQGSAAAQGGLLSGAALKAMQKYSQDFASNEYGNAYNRFTGDQQNMYNRLSNLAGTGQQQMNQSQQMQQNSMMNASGYLQDAAAAKASGIVGASNARQSGYGQIGNTLMDAYAINKANEGGFAANNKSGQSGWAGGLYENPSGMYVPKGGYYD